MYSGIYCWYVLTANHRTNGCKRKNISAFGLGRQERYMAWLPCGFPEKQNFRKSHCRVAKIDE
jgi:hypothetical protein